MEKIFHWNNNIQFPQVERESFEIRIEGDLNTAFKKDPKEAHVYFEKYTPGILSGFINDESGKMLCTFTCNPLENNTSTYYFR